MNKHLFRAKLKTSNEWIYWNIYGELTTSTGKRHSLKVERKYGHSLYYNVEQIRALIRKETIGASIGLRDKRKTLIFSGDILSAFYDDEYPNDESIELVIWDERNMRWATQSPCDVPGKPFYLPDGFDDEYGSEQIIKGNKWDTPELLGRNNEE